MKYSVKLTTLMMNNYVSVVSYNQQECKTNICNVKEKLYMVYAIYMVKTILKFVGS